MTESEVIDAAREAGLEGYPNELMRFAAIISAKQKEKDARICELRVWGIVPESDSAAEDCADAIRGQK